ncbi:MAG TPA: lysophospholipid acyltransferase family protein [Gammaproteobacteria bacterium]|nr:lysophospholipid acyltransferase family protein [Gammaproteobacteria bacterium]
MRFSNLPLWLLAGILWLVIQLPYAIQLKIGGFFGWLAFHFSKRERRIAEINIQKCFPQLDLLARKTLIKNSFISAGQGMIETLFGFWGSPKRLKKLAHIQNLHILQNALKQKKGVIVFGPHLSSVHFVGRLLNLVQPVGGMYFPPKNAFLRNITERALSHCFEFTVKRHEIRSFVKAMKNNKTILYTPDIDAGKEGLFVPFFNIPASTVTATSRFAEMTDCIVIPGYYCRRKDNTGIDIIFHEPLDNFPSGDVYADTLRINQWLEKVISEHPEQFIWQYKRFKSRPVGEKSFYA